MLLSAVYKPIGAAPVEEDENDGYPSLQSNDWVISLDIRRKKELLNYAGSQVYPITSMKVAYQVSNRFDKTIDTTAKIYEELWYHEGKALGSRRYADLEIPRQKQGIIFVKARKDVFNEPRVVAHAIVLLTVELALKDIVVTGIMVPADLFDDVAISLKDFGFYNNTEPLKFGGKQTSLYLFAHPAGKESSFYYQKRW